MRYLEHKGYIGSIEYDRKEKNLHGKIIGIRDLIRYKASTGAKLETNFKKAVEGYINDCKKSGVKPENPFKGSFTVRIPSKLHREAVLKAMEENASLNEFVSEAIREKIK